MQPLLDAFINRIGADAVLAQIAGAAPAVYLGQAPEAAAMPLITLHVTSAAPGPAGTHDFAGDRITHSAVALTAVAGVLTTALALADRLTTLLDASTFPLSAGVLLECRLSAAPQPARSGFDGTNNEIYHVEVKFNCSVYQAAGA